MLLAIDTSGDVCGLALAEAGCLRASANRAMTRGHAEALLPMLAGLLDDEGLSPADIDRIAVTVGPGSFTGLRVGIAAARGLALALGIPAEGFGTLEAIALAARDVQGAQPVLACLAGRGDEIVVQAFSDSGEAVSGPERLSAGDAARRFAGWQGLLAGSGAMALRAVDPSFPEPCEVAGRIAAALAIHASARPPEAARMPPRPFYNRPPDARPSAPVRRRSQGERR